MLSPYEVERFWSDGFLAMESFIDESTVSELRRAYDDIIEGRVLSKTDRMLGGITRQVLVPSMVHPVFEMNQAIERATDVVRALLGTATASRTYDMLIDKPAGHPYETPWHQDVGYYAVPTAPAGTTAPMTTLQFWVALDEVDIDNGCMEFLPACHTGSSEAHEVTAGAPNDDGRLIAMVDRQNIDPQSVAACPLPAGGATVHTALTPHRTGPNRTASKPRRAYIFNLLATDADERGIELFMRQQYVRSIENSPLRYRAEV